MDIDAAIEQEWDTVSEDSLKDMQMNSLKLAVYLELNYAGQVS